MDALRAAIERLKEGEREPALASLLDAWRTTRAPELAGAIDRLSAELTASERPIASKKEWEAAAKAARPAAMGRLLEAVPASLERVARLERLCALPADPRVGSFARAWLEESPVSSAKRATFFPALAALLEHTRDPRLTELVAQLTQTSERSATIAKIGLRAWKPFVAHAATLASIPVHPVDAKLLAELVALLDKGPSPAADPRALYAAVFASPGDDEARAVLSDLLQQQGDPRGEFIALQLARHGTNQPPSARERKLEKTWGRDWLGAIEPSLLKSGVVFERGFVARCRYGGDFAEADEWSTVTHIDVTQTGKFGKDHAALFQSLTKKSLRHVVGMSVADLRALEVVPWETVGFILWHWDRYGDAIARGSGTRFPAATKLVLAQIGNEGLSFTTEQLAALLDAWPTITELEVDTSPDHLPYLSKRLARVVVHAQGKTYESP